MDGNREDSFNWGLKIPYIDAADLGSDFEDDSSSQAEDCKSNQSALTLSDLSCDIQTLDVSGSASEYPNTSGDRGGSVPERTNSLSSEGKQVLPWDQFSNWFHCICIVTFDLEIGQALEMVYPGHAKLTEEEKLNICYLAFPDSNSGQMGDSLFHFRIQASSRRPLLAHVNYNRSCPVPLQVNNSYFYGYVFFRQVKDRNLRRGYFQKSVVLISKLPFVRLFYHILESVAPEFFEGGEASLEAACHDIDSWPSPLPGDLFNLPLLGNILQVRIPTKHDKIGTGFALEGQSSPPHSPSSLIGMGTYGDRDSFRLLFPILTQVHLLWELVLTAEPLVVMASTPGTCSEMVQALIGLIWPLKYAADFLSSKPHKQKLRRTVQMKTLDCKPGVYTQAKPFLQKDKVILKKVLKGFQSSRPLPVQNALLRRHLMELTQSFMIPLERYMGSLMPLQKNISPFRAAPTLRPFNPDEFLATLDTTGPHLTTGVKGDWAGLYRKFFRCPNFSGWYNSRYKEAHSKLQALHLQALSSADVLLWTKGKAEVEMVDMFLRLQKKLETAREDDIPVDSKVLKNLEARIHDLHSSLPPDLQNVLHSRSEAAL
ncbi:unnamed protein product [Darwinula stevensoni]|uniref:UDENN domain-containing protein n=1 Tax=Darwinula stevensoni TaxID=69355 RepID=A0A7R8XCX2_9CRUS|nr:unnamed protein product [Darwinula stevensoni]CAG0892421.1 unnamed protein product [Darwinula stevensoni]